MGKRVVPAMTMAMALLAATESAAAEQRICPEGFEILRNRNWSLAIEKYTDCLDKAKLSPKDRASAYSYRAYAHAKNENYRAAIADDTRAIRLDPSVAENYNQRGSHRSDVGEYHRAIADFDKAIAIDPRRSYAYHNRGVVFFDQGRYRRAITDFDAAIRAMPDNAGAHDSRGVTYEKLGDYDRAVADYSKAIELGMYDRPTYHKRAFAQFQRRQFAESAKDLRLVAKAYPGDRYMALLYVTAVAWREWEATRRKSPALHRSEIGRVALTEAAAEITRFARTFDGDGWPGAIVNLYSAPFAARSTESAVAALLDAAARSKERPRKKTLCEANAYAGHYLVILGEAQRGIELLREARSLCRPRWNGMSMVSAVLRWFDLEGGGASAR